MKRNIYISLILLLVSLVSYGQKNNSKPTSIELMIGHQHTHYGLATTMPVYKNLYFNNITTASSPYKFDVKNNIELVSVNSLIYKFSPHIGVSGGMQYHFKKGIVPNIALHTSYINRTWLILATPYLSVYPWLGTEMMALIAYRPTISQNIKLYTKAQGLYGHNLEKKVHERSFTYLRLGLSYKKWTIGAAANFDFYGKNMAKKTENYGAFLMLNL